MDYKPGDTICIRIPTHDLSAHTIYLGLSPEVINFALGYELVAQDGKVIADAAP